MFSKVHCNGVTVTIVSDKQNHENGTESLQKSGKKQAAKSLQVPSKYVWQ